jgi:peroxiredoxin Q/BCP
MVFGSMKGDNFMALKPGQIAPSFTMEDLHGHSIALTDYQHQRVFLSFLRFAGCPFCGLRVYGLSLRYPIFQQAGVAVIGVVESSQELAQKHMNLRDAPFPIIADPQSQLYRRYQAKATRWGFWRTLRRRDAEFQEADQHGFVDLVNGGPRNGDGNLYRLPAEFLIGPDQRIEQLHYGKDIGDFLPFDTIQTWIATPLVKSA